MKQLAFLAVGSPIVYVMLGFAPAVPNGDATPPRARSAPAPDLVGLWEAKRRFGPDVRGRLVIRAHGLPDQPNPRALLPWRATIAGRSRGVSFAGDTLSFALADNSGSFIGAFDASRNAILGHWIQPPTWRTGGEVASPVTLVSCGRNCFAGEVVPLNDEYTFYLQVTRRADGALGAVLRNPERNLGRQFPVDRIEMQGTEVRWLNARGEVINRGIMRDSVMTFFLGGRGGSYDFRRVPDTAYTYFYPRGQPTTVYGYKAPLDERDGWQVGTLDEVGLSREKISDMIRFLSDAPRDSIGALKVHGILIARRGKLVLEEYFYGEHGDKPHDTRSASKTMTSIVIGAAALAGARVSPETPVYGVMRPHAANLEPRKRALKLEHLLTMSSGFDCDDNSETSPGNEETIFANAGTRDWSEIVLDLGMIRDPGAEFVYCAASVQLAGGVVSRAAGRSFLDLTRHLVAEPLGIRHYYAGVTSRREAVLGGGWYFRPRDFMKLGQLYLNGGVWNGRRVVSQDWVRRSTAVRYTYGSRLKYGYLWWIIDYPYGKGTVRAYFASGLGGQEVMVFPELDLVFASFGGNYGDHEAGWAAVTDLVPKYVLPAIVPGK